MLIKLLKISLNYYNGIIISMIITMLSIGYLILRVLEALRIAYRKHYYDVLNCYSDSIL